MHTRSIILVALGVVVGAGAVYFLLSSSAALAPVVENPPVQTATTTPAGIVDLITVTSPLPNTTISSPLTITGEARGPWYFEASAPVILKDSNGVTIAEGHVTAQGDWMTTDFVSFTATLSFTAPTTTTGTLILKNDNPSGEPSRDKSVSIPVKFY